MRDQLASRQITAHIPAADVIEFTISEPSSISLSILDENGKTIENILRALPFRPGTHELHFNSSRYAGGTHYYRLSAVTDSGEVVDTKKIIIPANLS